MKREEVNYVVAGGFVVLVGVAIIVTLLALSGRSGPADTYFVEYPRVAGMKFGTVVSYAGYRVGQVKDIDPVHTDAGVRYRITLGVTRGWPIQRGSVARVVSSGLIAAVSIDIRPGRQAGRIEPGSEIPGEGSVDLFAALSQAANDFRSLTSDSLRPLAETLTEEVPLMLADLRVLTRQVNDPALFENMKRLTGRASELAERLNQVLDAGTLARTREALDSTARLSAELRETNRLAQNFLTEENARQVGTALAGMGAAAEQIGRVASVAESVFSPGNQRRLNQIIVNLDGTARAVHRLSGELGGTRGQVDEILGAVGQVVDENRGNVSRAVADLRASLEVLASHVDSIAYHLEGSSRNLHEFTRQIRENPGLLLRASPQRDPQ